MVLGLKVVVLGDSGVGKTTLVKAWAQRELPSGHHPTAGDCIQRIPIGDPHEATLMVHELGVDVALDDARNVIRNADAVVLIFDCQRFSQTLQALEDTWIPRLKMYKETYATYFLVANRAYCDGDPSKEMPFTLQEVVHWHLLPVPLEEVRTLSFTDLDSIRDGSPDMFADLYTFAKASMFVRLRIEIQNAKAIARHRRTCQCCALM